jgi:ABC-2 type transport system ATP-binding protein
MGVIEIDGLSKTFNGRRVLNNITFAVEEGEMFGYLGPNGAGKTTTMRVLLGLIRPTSGSALVRGVDLAINDPARAEVGVLMENDGLYDRISAFENLDYYGKLYSVQDRRKRITDLLEMFGLADRKDDRVHTYSKGMRRKLGIARAIIHDPEILFLDEPTSGLDPEAQKMVREVLTGLSRRERMTVLLSSHNLDEVQKVCSRVAVIKRGELRACDTVDNLRGGKGSHTLSIVTSDEAEAARAVALGKDLPSVIGARADGNVAVLTHLDESAAPLISALVQKGISMEEARKTSRSLEDVYIDLVKEQEGSA